MNEAAAFTALRASEAYRARHAPERLARLPDLSAAARIVPQVFSVLFALAAAAMFLVMLSAVPYVEGVGRVLLFVALIVPAGFAVLGLVLLGRFRRRLAEFDCQPAIARAAIVVAKHRGAGGRSQRGAAGGHYLVVELEGGIREQFEALSPALYRAIAEGEAGVLFSRGDVAIDFDRAA